MIELIAYGQRLETATAAVGDSHVLDLSNPGAISLTYQVGKGEEVLGRYSPFSQTFRLPFSNVNTVFFGHYYDVNIDPTAITTGPPTFNIHNKVYCEIRVDGVPIIQGSLQLKNIYLKDEEFEIVVFGLEANLFQEIKDLKLIDAFKDSSGNLLTTYDVLMTGANIKTSFDITQDATEGTVGAGIVMFPIIDYGHSTPYNFLHYQNDAVGQSGLAVENYLHPFQLKPAFKVKKLLELIINNAGYSIDAATSTFLDTTAFTKLYMTLGSDREVVATRPIQGVLAGKNDGDVVQTWTNTSATSASTTPLNADSGAGYGTPANPSLLYDEGNHYDTTTYIFTAPNDGYFFGEAHGTFDSSSCLTGFGAEARVGVQGGSIGSQADVGVQNFSLTTALPGASGLATIVTTISTTWSGFLYAGQGVRMLTQANVFGASGTLRLMSEGTYFIVQASNMINGYASIPYNMPDLNQTDFIKDIVQRFNLCVVSDPDNPLILTIQPWQDYIDAGIHKDWTHKLDLSQSRQIKSTDTLRKKFIHYHDAEDTTNINTKQQKYLGHTLGEYLQEIGGDFIEGTLENESIFAPFNVQRVPRVDDSTASDAPEFLIAREYSADTEGPVSDASPKLFYHNNLKTLNGNRSFFVGDTNCTQYPLCLPFYNNGQQMAIDSPLLLWQFAVPPEFYGQIFGTTPSNQGYFARYYQQFLLSIYDEEARLMECSMMLNPSDIFSFRFNDEIQVENATYRVLKIANYQPFAGVPSKVTLLKKVEKEGSLFLPDPDDECTLNVQGYLANGNVLFINPLDGTTSSGTQVCCEENHFFWNGDDCLWNTGAGGGGGTQPTQGDPNLPWVGGGGKSYLTGVGGFNSLKTLGVTDINPIAAEHSIRGMNFSSSAPSVNKEFVFYATSYSSVPILATPDGDTLQSSSFTLPEGYMARFVVRVLSVQTDSGTTSGSFGSTSFRVWTFVAKNIANTITTSGNEQTDFRQDDGDVGTRTLSVAGAKGQTSFNPNDTLGVAISLTGSVDTVVAWHLDCSVTFVDLSGYTAFNSDLILQENMGYIETENGNFIEQE
tara:strand:+ start:2551 stop:5733 length:3183 start_codon:yes stop_codon:yes gene_type:complete